MISISEFPKYGSHPQEDKFREKAELVETLFRIGRVSGTK
jgi:hypothetical protein